MHDYELTWKEPGEWDDNREYFATLSAAEERVRIIRTFAKCWELSRRGERIAGSA
jgi:hypothetical protein